MNSIKRETLYLMQTYHWNREEADYLRYWYKDLVGDNGILNNPSDLLHDYVTTANNWSGEGKVLLKECAPPLPFKTVVLNFGKGPGAVGAGATLEYYESFMGPLTPQEDVIQDLRKAMSGGLLPRLTTLHFNDTNSMYPDNYDPFPPIKKDEPVQVSLKKLIFFGGSLRSEEAANALAHHLKSNPIFHNLEQLVITGSFSIGVKDLAYILSMLLDKECKILRLRHINILIRPTDRDGRPLGVIDRNSLGNDLIIQEKLNALFKSGKFKNLQSLSFVERHAMYPVHVVLKGVSNEDVNNSTLNINGNNFVYNSEQWVLTEFAM